MACRGGVVGFDGFDTQIRYSISDDSSKRFYLTIRRDPSTGVIRSRTGRFDPEAFRNYVDDYAKDRIEREGFCRRGFFVIDRSDNPANGFLRGECRESATPEDVARWGAN